MAGEEYKNQAGKPDQTRTTGIDRIAGSARVPEYGRMPGSRRRDRRRNASGSRYDAAAGGIPEYERSSAGDRIPGGDQVSAYAGLRTDQALVGRREAKLYEDEQMSREYLPQKKSIPVRVIQWSFQILAVIIAAYLLVYFFGQRRTNIGPSMDTTLSGGDEVLINILSYQMKGPSRGDIISFKPNANSSSRSSIRRVIGLPGETVQIIDGMIYIDGKVFLEKKDYPAIISPGMAEEPIRLEVDEYFVLGDNRNNSEDSRNAQIGLVTSSMIEGRAWFILRPGEHRGLIRK